ncbi:hypothetical protein [Pedobacter panaciterrae]
MPVDFQNIDYQIELNEKRLEQERERTVEIKSRVNYIALVYTVFAFFLTSLLKFVVQLELGSWLCWLFTSIFSAFIVLLIISIHWTIKLLIPKEFAFIEEPRIFYGELKEDYIKAGVGDDLLNDCIKKSYLQQIETALNGNISTNNNKSRSNYYAIKFAFISIIPYIICVSLMVVFNKDEVQNVYITNKNMSKSNNKQKVEPPKIIVRPPVMIKENSQIPSSIKDKGTNNKK